MTKFVGTCDVCGEEISFEFDFSKGIIDVSIMPDGRVKTWVRHYATAPKGANPDCAIYSSTVYEVKEDGTN